MFAYDQWANREVIASLRAAGAAPPPRSLRWMAHIVAAERLWLARLKGESPGIAVWPDLTVDQCEEEVRALGPLWDRYRRALGSSGLDEPVEYRNSKGEPWRSAVGDILTHVVMHSAYHRGQIAADLRQAGHEPSYTDFIHSVRQGFIKP